MKLPSYLQSLLIGLLLLLATEGLANITKDELSQLQAIAKRVSIKRDNWGIAHISANTDADAIFGMMYAQAEDDFFRIQKNYLISLGRLALLDGEDAIWSDLRARLYIDDADLKTRYTKSPKWLKELMQAWANGLNFYLAKHPKVKTSGIQRYEPWMALSFSEGSIGGDIERISLDWLKSFYGNASTWPVRELLSNPGGSNGFAIAPKKTKNKKALLWINPHTTFYFRSEAHVTSNEGLNVYGASTWGQFFVYQGFNEYTGWMHTSSGVDVIDEFREEVKQKGNSFLYRYGKEWRKGQTKKVSISYLDRQGNFKTRHFNTFHTHHGPIIRSEGERWISFAMMFRPVLALEQSYLRTKSKSLQEFIEASKRNANSSNNTVIADKHGAIAYLHPQFIPRRDNQFDYTEPVDGFNPGTDWNGFHIFSDSPNVVNPRSGFITNTNNWPYSCAGDSSPTKEDYPHYMDRFGENARGVHATRLLKDKNDFTINSLIEIGFDSYLYAFEVLIPPLLKALKEEPRKEIPADVVTLLSSWDYRFSIDSEATTIAHLWAENLRNLLPARKTKGWQIPRQIYKYKFSKEQMTTALSKVIEELKQDFGTHKVAWGKINRFQRLAEGGFADDKESTAISYASGRWGALPAFYSRKGENTRKHYGFAGNTFVAAVEFGEKVRAFALREGGQSSDPSSPHFNDQVEDYQAGKLRPVYFYPEELAPHVKRSYHPGEK